MYQKKNVERELGQIKGVMNCAIRGCSGGGGVGSYREAFTRREQAFLAQNDMLKGGVNKAKGWVNQRSGQALEGYDKGLRRRFEKSLIGLEKKLGERGGSGELSKEKRGGAD